jgi:hypothetical protein
VSRYIHVDHACPVGLTIVEQRIAAWQNHDAEQVKLADQAASEHLRHCEQCNPDLLSEKLQRSLFRGREVKVMDDHSALYRWWRDR